MVGVIGHRWVIESVFLRSPYKGFWACLGDLPPDMPRRPETWVSLCNLKLTIALLSSDRIGLDHRVTIGGVIPLIPCTTNYCRIFKATTAYTSGCTDTRAVLAPQLSGGPRVHHWQSARSLWQDRGGCSFPWMIAVD